jgi:septum formation protein
VRERRAGEQARAAARGKSGDVSGRRPGAWVIGADTVVTIDRVTFGQPVDEADAGRMLQTLSGRVHSVISAVCVVAPDGRSAEGHAISRVRMKKLSPLRISRYIGSGEAMGKAGAYAIQGEAGEFCSVVRGSVDNVIGLPLQLVKRLLRRLDFGEATLW